MRHLKLFIAVAALVVVCVSPVRAAEHGVPDIPIQITGESVEYFYAEERAVGSGDIRIEYKGWTLTADEVAVNLKTKEASAKGNVTLVQEGAIYTGDAVQVNFETKSAEISNLSGSIAPHYTVQGKEVRKVNDAYYQVSDGYITTCHEDECDGDDIPYYRIQSKEVTYYPEDKVVVRHAVLYIGKIPFFYVPIIVIPIVDVDRFPIQVEVGKRKEWGAYALTKMRYWANKDFKGNFLFDVREKQGLAGGIENFYDSHAIGQGAARFYYADDQCGADESDCAASEGHISPESSRYRAQLRHRWQIYENTALNAEINKLSDEFVIQDFFYRNEYEKISFPDNYVSVIHSEDDYTLSGLTRFRLDDFVPVVERTPEIRFDTHTHAFEDLPVYYRQEVQVSNLDRRFKDEEDVHQEATRVDTRHSLSLVQRFDPVTVTPFVALRETYYTRDSSGEKREFIRGNMEAGFDASAKFFRTYEGTVQALGLDWNDFRHIFTPAAHYRYQSKPTHVREDLYGFDAIDDIDHHNFFQFDFENKIQTKSHTGHEGELSKRTLLRTLVYTDLQTPQADRVYLNTTGIDVEFDPYGWLTIASDAAYSWETDAFASANIDAVVHWDEIWFGVGQRYSHEVSNQTTFQLDWKVSENWHVRLYERYEFENSETDEFEITVERAHVFCWTVRLTYNTRNGEDSVFVSFSPSAYPDTAFQSGQTYRRIEPGVPTSGMFTSADY